MLNKKKARRPKRYERTLARLVRAHRAERNLTLRDLVKRTRIPLSHLHAIEHAKHRLALDDVLTLARELGLSPTALIGSILGW